MKTKLTLTVDEELVPIAKRYARTQGVSLSQLVERALRQMSGDEVASFSRRWRGKFVEAKRDSELYRVLAKRHL